MSMAAAAFMYGAIATSTAALGFLTGQKTSGRTSKEVEACYENVALLEGLARDLRELAAESESEELAKARDRLEEAVVTLRRGADLVV